jgi:hypothetical protein
MLCEPNQSLVNYIMNIRSLLLARDRFGGCTPARHQFK